jgi:hypothetical protein
LALAVGSSPSAAVQSLVAVSTLALVIAHAINVLK